MKITVNKIIPHEDRAMEVHVEFRDDNDTMAPVVNVVVLWCLSRSRINLCPRYEVLLSTKPLNSLRRSEDPKLRLTGSDLRFQLRLGMALTGPR